MRRILRVVLAATALHILPTTPLWAAGDPSAIFLDAYTNVRDAEKLEREGNFQAALSKYRYAGSLLDQVNARNPEWHTVVVEYRRKRTAEAISALQEKIALEPKPTQQEVATVNQGVTTDPLDPGLPTATPVPPLGAAGATPATGEDILERTIRDFRIRMGQLQSELDNTKARLGVTERERIRMVEELSEARKHSANPAQIEAFHETEKQLKEQIVHLQGLLAKAGANPSGGDQKLWDELEAARAEAARVRTQLEKAQASETALVNKLTIAEAKYVELERNTSEARTAASDEIRTEIAKLQNDLIDARADREIAEEQGAIMSRKMAALAKRPDLTKELAAAKEKADTIAAENKKLSKAADEADRKLTALVKALDAEKGAKAEVDQKLTTAQDRIKELEEAEAQLVAVTKERNRAQEKQKKLSTTLEERIKEIESLNAERTALTKERDEAIRKAAEINQSSDKLLSGNQELLKKLEAAEANLGTLNAAAPEQQKEIERLKKELEETNQGIAKLKQSAETDKNTIADLHIQLDTLTAAADGKIPAPEQARLTEENELLRGIVTRKLRDQVQRDQARTAIAEELARLQVRSKAINDQVAVLSAPTIQLTEKERALFKTPQLEIIDNQSDSMIFSIFAPQNEKPVPATGELPPAQKKRVTESEALASGEASAASSLNRRQGGETEGRQNIPEHLQPTAQEARYKFDKGEYAAARELYEKLTAEVPENIYFLSNLGMSLYRSGKLREAEETFKKLLTIEPNDAYSHTTLGIVYHAQSKYDEAIDALTRSIAVNPKNPMAHNFLGVTAAKKGWTEAARKEIQTAIEIDPAYADAHFNLAVVFATTQPADKENARKHYRKAVELGVKPDPTLENLIR